MDSVYLNGSFVPKNSAKVSVFDRGFLFADSVYEVTSVVGGRLVDFDAHYARLARSCTELELKLPFEVDHLEAIHHELINKNNLIEGVVYLHISRGVTDRDFIIDNAQAPTVMMFTQVKNILNHPKIETGLKVMTLSDERWARRDIKTTQLLSQSLAKTRAAEQGFDDAWFVQDGYVTEGTSNNAFIATREGTLITRPRSPDILPGITREVIMACAAETGLKLEERVFTIDEALTAQEAFITSASTFIWPVVEINGTRIGAGKPGEIYRSLRRHYLMRLERLGFIRK